MCFCGGKEQADFVQLLLCSCWEPHWREVGLTLVLDNCTVPRSVVPISVSMWPWLQEPYLGCTSSLSYPVSSPSCLTYPHNTPGGRQRDSTGWRGQTWGVLWNQAFIRSFSLKAHLWTYICSLYCVHGVWGLYYIGKINLEYKAVKVCSSS